MLNALSNSNAITSVVIGQTKRRELIEVVMVHHPLVDPHIPSLLKVKSMDKSTQTRRGSLNSIYR
jgi:hypothetical protein